MDWAAVIAAAAAVLAALAAFGGFVLAWVNRNHLQTLQINIDGRMDALLTATGLAGEAKGVAQERQEERGRVADVAAAEREQNQ
jgi:hypothetical protein